MSVEAPEAYILGKQMSEALPGRKVKKIELRDYEKMQRIGFIDKDLTKYQNLVGGVIERVMVRGNTIDVTLSNGFNLIIGPEYGGTVRLSLSEEKIKKFHLLVSFYDRSALSIRLTSMGMINVVKSNELYSNYMYKRDFSDTPSPLDDHFDKKAFIDGIQGQSKNLKALLVGKEAVIVGLSNSGFQDVIYRSKLHPKRKGSDLSKCEAAALYEAINKLMKDRLIAGGKTGFTNLYGSEGKYKAKMGPNMKDMSCPICGSEIVKIKHGGGQVYLCPSCQK